MLTHLADISIQSLLLALPAAIVPRLPGISRTAALQHAVWSAVVCGMLALFAFGQALPRLHLPVPQRPAAAILAIQFDRLTPGDSASGGAPHSPVTAVSRHSFDPKDVVLFGYCGGVFAFLARFLTGIFLVRKLLATARPVSCPGANDVYESRRISVPVTAGWLRPRILLPEEWRQWDRNKLNAVLAHEDAHRQRRDPLVAVLAGINRSLFWFHPLAWILERRLALLADQACDEFCVATLGDRNRYARVLLEMAQVVDVSRGRLRRHALTMAEPSHIRRRIDALLQEGRTFSRGLTRTGWVAVALCGIPVLFAAGAVSLEAPQAQSASASPARPQFEVASVKPNTGCEYAPPKSGSFSPSPGRLEMPCVTLQSLIQTAYGTFGDGITIDPQPLHMEGGPSWMRSQRYSVTAKAEANGPTRTEMLAGPMLQVLLEERFQLKTHRENRETPVFAMTVAKGGLKVQPLPEGGCAPVDLSHPPPLQKPGDPLPNVCGVMILRLAGNGGTIIEVRGVTMKQFAERLSGRAGRTVIDKTGIPGMFNFHLEYTPDPTTAGADRDQPSLFAALQEQLGLKLSSDKGPVSFLIVDQVDTPTPN